MKTQYWIGSHSAFRAASILYGAVMHSTRCSEESQGVPLRFSSKLTWLHHIITG